MLFSLELDFNILLLYKFGA